MVIHIYFCTKGYDYVKRFVRVFVLLVVDKYRVSQNIAKNGEHCIVDFQFKLKIKRHAQEAICVPHCLAIF